LRPFLPQVATQLRLGWRWPDGLRALRYRNFRLFFLGQTVSLTGNWMQTTALQWLVYSLTGSQLSLGMVTFASYIPVLVLSLFMGVIVDRVARRRLILLTQSWFMVLAVILAVLTFSGRIQYWHILALAILLGIGNALDMPARQAFFADIVERDDLMNAIALNSSVFNGARIIGPAIGGWVVGLLGEAPAFALNAVSFGGVLLGLLLIQVPQRAKTAKPMGSLGELRQGVAYLIRERRVLGLVTMIAVFSVVGFPYVVLLPVFARDILQVGASGLGVLLASQGVGALSAALLLAFAGDRRHRGRMTILSRALLPAATLVLALSRTMSLSMLALVFAGYAFISQSAVTNTLIQLIVPDELRGRVISAYTWALGGFWPIGALLMGAAGDRLGAPTAVMLFSGICALIAILGALAFPEIRDIQ
jgi:MFS family permease